MFTVSVGPHTTYLGVWAEVETPVEALRWDYDLRQIADGTELIKAVYQDRDAALAQRDYNPDQEQYLRDAAHEVVVMFRSMFPDVFAKKAA